MNLDRHPAARLATPASTYGRGTGSTIRAAISTVPPLRALPIHRPIAFTIRLVSTCELAVVCPSRSVVGRRRDELDVGLARDRRDQLAHARPAWSR
jgi:hypothetical protein